MNQEKIWNHFQNNPEMDGFAFNSAKSRYRFIVNQIKPGMNVLNIGIGRGGLEELLLAEKVNVHCLDPIEESISALQSRFNLGDKAKVGYSQSIPFDNQIFDVVVMSEVLEHLSEEVINETIKEVHRVLRQGGRFVGTVPANEELLENQVICPDCGKIFHRWGHLQSFSSERLNQILSRQFNGPKIARMYFGNWETLNWKGRFSWILKSLAVLIGIKGAGENFFFSAKK